MKPNQLRLGTQTLFFLKRPIRLPLRDARTHMHVIGVSGSGKSRFLAGLCLEFLRTGLAGTLLDPHGDLGRLLVGSLAERGFYGHPGAFDEVLYLDLPAAERADRYLPLNVFATPGAPDVIAANVMEAMHRAWPSLAGGAAPRFDSFIQYGIPVLLANDLPLPALTKLLADKPFRDACLESEQDADIVEFWHGWYDSLSDRLRLDYVDSTLSRIRLLTRAPVLRYSLSQQTNTLNWRQIFDQGKSVIVNLALQNQDAQKLLGCLLMVGAEQGALSRAESPPEERGRPHMMVIDEFPEFTAKSEEAAARMLSQTRKYGLHLILAHQNWTQTSDRLRGALQNVKIEVSFQLGREDAERSAKVLTRVDPRSVSHRVDEETEGLDIRHQWEAATQALVDQLAGKATLKLPGNRKHRWEFWKSWHARTVQVQTMKVPDPKVHPSRLSEIEDRYLTQYFRSRADVELLLAAKVETEAPSLARHRPTRPPR